MPLTPLQIERFPLGQFATNCYVLTAAGEAWIVDPGFFPDEVIDHCDDRGLRPSRVLLTHAHLDHIAGLPDILRRWPDLPVHLHPAEHGWPSEPRLNLSQPFGFPLTAPEPTDTLEHGQVLRLGGLPFRVLHTPGHSPGGVTFFQPDHLAALVGDTLFHESVGRTDFPFSDPAELVRSIREQLFTLPDDTRVYPGHYEPTTIGHERRHNPYVGELADRD
jgi:glyoxylase-like metal-dependent hydrolase (beta-lactamase superfamily II)